MTTLSNPPLRPLAGGAPPTGGLPPGAAATRALPTRRRPWPLAAVGALLVVGFALLGGVLLQRAAAKTPVLVVERPVPAGQVIRADDLGTVPVAGPVRVILAGEGPSVVGRTAAVDLVPGQLLNRDMVTDVTVPSAGQALIGLDLRPGLLPTGDLQPGDRVRIVAAPAQNDTADAARLFARPVLLAQDARVYAVRPNPTNTGSTLVSVLVPQDVAARLSTYSSAGQAALIEEPR